MKKKLVSDLVKNDPNDGSQTMVPTTDCHTPVRRVS